jgi:hypothetical protein
MTDDGRQVMAKAHIAFGKVSLKCINNVSMYLYVNNLKYWSAFGEWVIVV